LAVRKKVTVVGVGMVGGATVQYLAKKDYCDIVMVDVVDGLPQGKALDLHEAGPIEGFDGRLIGTVDYEETANSDVVVITSGLPRKPGMSRDDLLFQNALIVQSVVEKIVQYSPKAVLIVVTNPLDAMAQLAYHTSGFPRNQVMGMAGVLDSARFRTFIADELNVSVQEVTGFVLGGHGDTMVPLPRYSTVAGIPITELLSPERIQAICHRTAYGGGEIVSLLKTGSAFYAPGAAICSMIDAVLVDKKRILPCTVYLDGEYGVKGLFMGVPVKVGAGGVEEIIKITLTDEEMAAFQRSAAAVQELIDTMRTRIIF
jgi:malate dehydrogenase